MYKYAKIFCEVNFAAIEMSSCYELIINNNLLCIKQLLFKNK